MQKSLAFLFLLEAWCIAGCGKTDPTDSGLGTTPSSKVVIAQDQLAGRWRKMEGEEWRIIELTKDGAYSYARYHDGSGGREGVDREKGMYRLVEDDILEIRLEGGGIKRKKVAVTLKTLVLDSEEWKRY